MSSPRPLRVGLNLLFLGERAAGVGRYAVELIGGLLEAEPETRLSLFVNLDAPEALRSEPWASSVDWVRMRVRVRGRAHVLAQQTVLPVAAARRKLDVLHSPANAGPLFAPGVANVVTIHDLIWFHQRELWETGVAARALSLVVRASARTADRVITDSQASRDDMVSALGTDPERIDVVPLGVRADARADPFPEDELRARLELGHDPIVLCVAQKRPYKNLQALVRAVAEIQDVALVVPGQPTPHEGDLREHARHIGVEERIHFPAWVSESELEGLYRAASCFVLPSFVEGFGLPVLEAMARGVPVACSNRPALPEVVGDAALLFDPDDQAAVTMSVRRLVRDQELASDLAQRGRAQARKYSWKRTGQGTLSSYRRALAARDRRSSRSALSQ